ncbi:error-prone DNA polymerase [Hyphomicrobium sp.]|uniref:error-prone DNA polymerase n=1 Tax=Hyphomicrobium sp. TaxID=82 RepID=UPI000F9B0785|nr:error-prone DNA polymerase [Hyphomicrobium sp.]RUP09469.1 MAG: error-prone DNA polymerase [Hyphomicrobium sp.]
MTLRYAELQVTTNFSFLRGASHADDLVEQAKALGLSAIAVTDRNSLAGVVRAYVAAKAEDDKPGIRLVIGVRLDLEDAPSLLVYPTDRAAYGRLCRLLSHGQLKADKGKCVLHLADVAAHAEGQIFIALPPEDWDWREVTLSAARRPVPEIQTGKIIPFESVRERLDSSAPPPLTPPRKGEGNLAPSPRSSRGEDQGEGQPHAPNQQAPLTPALSPCQAQRHGEREVLEISLGRIIAAVGNAPLYLAASHTYRGDDRSRIAALAALGDRCGTPIVATNDVLYHHPDCRPLQDVVTCIREKTTLREAGLRLEANAERYIKSPEEMAYLFRGHEAALARTLDIVEACRFSLSDLKYEYPDEPVPPGKTPQEHLVALTWRGAASHFAEGIPEKVRDAIEKELKLIGELKFAPYFLTVHDIVAFARSREILCQGRGSAANSVVCYCLGITAVNPVEVDLLFERFISSARLEPPDIDVDFEHERREEVIQWIYKRYGRHRAGLTATVISYRSRSAVRDVGKVFGLSEDSIAALAGMVWGTHAGGVPPEQHVRGAGLDPTDRTLAAAMKLAQELMGFPRHLSQHVGGFVLTRGPLVEVVPVGNAAMADRTFIEWDKDDIAALGLMKVDVLALGMLTCVRKAFDLIAQHHDRPLTLATLPRGDTDTYDMLCRADSIGVFQVESRAQMNMLPRLKPRKFYDLVIEVAIVRPGPIQGDMVHPYLRRRSGLETVAYPYPKGGDEDELRNILGKTLGVPLFQEQAMRIAMVAAQFDDKEVNELRRAMATFRRVGKIGLLEEKMVSRMVGRGYEREFAERCFSQIKGFGEYGFPESHAASFALLVYVSSWIKCHYPAAFACALLNSQPMGFYAPAQIVRDAREHGVEVREADVNFSEWHSTLEPSLDGRGPALRLGLRLIDGLSEADIHEVPDTAPETKPASRRKLPTLIPPVPERQKHGTNRRFQSIQDVAKRGSVSTLEKLAAADAFRSLGLDRRQALWEVKALANAPPLPLFSWSETQDTGKEADVQLPAMALSEHVVNDYQTLRLSLKEHPMSFLREDFRRERVLSCKDLRDVKNGAFVRVAGVVLVRQRPGAGNVVFMTIEDETGVTNAIIWPNMLERFRKVVMTSRLILIEGRIQNQVEEHANIIHVVSTKLIDRSDWLLRLSEWAADMDVPHANADEVLHPEPGSAHPARKEDRRIHPRFSREPKPRHPRNVRIIPKSRDFH